MINRFEIIHNSSTSKVAQIRNWIITNIEAGALQKDERLMSINEFNFKFSVARDTVEKAYNMLKDEGYLTSVKGKGYFVAGQPDTRLKVLLCFNKLSSYKKIVYEAFVETLGKNATVDLYIHQYDPSLLRAKLEADAANYHYIAVMPHFFQSVKINAYLDVLNLVPVNKLMLLDKNLPELEGLGMSVVQDFENDIYQALNAFSGKLEKYSGITLVFPEHSHHPTEIKTGIKRFADENLKDLVITAGGEHLQLAQKQLYIVLTEGDLAALIKKIRNSPYRMGSEVGIISFNETIFKELLGVSVITTDFRAMGLTAANILLNNQKTHVHNPFLVIQRDSV